MSITFDTFTCDRCELQATSLVSVGVFNWVEDSRSYNVSRGLSVCASCQNISAAEVIPAWEEFIDEISLSRIGRFRRGLAAFALGGLSRLPMRTRDALDPASGFHLLLKIVDSGRRPVCLRCGSSDFQYLRLPAHYNDAGELFRTNHRHPGCDGHILAHGSGGARMAVEIETRCYDLDGRQVSGPPLGDGVKFVSGYAPPLR